MYFNNTKIIDVAIGLENIKDKVKSEIKKDKEGKLYLELELPVNIDKETIEIVIVEFYIDTFELRTEGEYLEFFERYEVKVIDNTYSGATFKVKELMMKKIEK